MKPYGNIDPTALGGRLDQLEQFVYSMNEKTINPGQGMGRGEGENVPVNGVTGFPTRHPLVGDSNVLIQSVTFDNKTYAIPTMIGGKKLSGREAVAIAKEHGLGNYPAFDSVQMAEDWIQRNHGNIGPDGQLR